VPETGRRTPPNENTRAALKRLWEPLAQFARPVVYLSHNLVSRTGVVLTSMSAATLLLTYAYQLYGHIRNPYAGILLFLVLPSLFVLGLLLIPAGVYREFRRDRRLGLLPAIYSPSPATAGPCIWNLSNSAVKPATRS
jgi:hypothetical protein